MLGELLDVVLGERADDDAVEVAREDDRSVAERLAAPELQLVGREVEPDPAELGDSDPEGDARARRRLLEDQADRPAGQELPLRVALQLVRQVEHGLELSPAPVRDLREAPAFQRCGKGKHEV